MNKSLTSGSVAEGGASKKKHQTNPVRPAGPSPNKFPPQAVGNTVQDPPHPLQFNKNSRYILDNHDATHLNRVRDRKQSLIDDQDDEENEQESDYNRQYEVEQSGDDNTPVFGSEEATLTAGINNFEIFDSVTRQISKEGLGKMVIPANNVTGSTNPQQINQKKQAIQEQVGDDFFEHRTGKKRSLTDECKKNFKVSDPNLGNQGSSSNASTKLTNKPNISLSSDDKNDRSTNLMIVRNSNLSKDSLSPISEKSSNKVFQTPIIGPHNSQHHQIQIIGQQPLKSFTQHPQKSSDHQKQEVFVQEFTERIDPSQRAQGFVPFKVIIEEDAYDFVKHQKAPNFFYLPSKMQGFDNLDDIGQITSGKKYHKDAESIQQWQQYNDEEEDESGEESKGLRKSAGQTGSQWSSYQYWLNKGINFKFKMPESKHFSGIAKLFTDFQKVTFDSEKDYPIFLLNQIYTPTVNSQIAGKHQDKKKRIALELKKLSEDCHHQFYSIIYCSYRKGFQPLLKENKEIIAYVESMLKPGDNLEKINTSTDANWGCTIRVGQMMLCQALQRHLIGEDYRLDWIVNDPHLSEIYKKIIKSVLDNDGSQNGAFSIQNIAKVGLCHNKLPGEWYGPHAIAIMMKDLNKLYRPFGNFQICIFHDGNIYYDKIKRLATQKLSQDSDEEVPRPYLVRSASIAGSPKDYDRSSKQNVNSIIEFIFKDYLKKIGHLKAYRQQVHGGYELRQKSTDTQINTEDSKTSSADDEIRRQWRNGVLVIIPTRLGLNKVNKEYFAPIQSIFQCKENVGIIGGKPSQALYFVGSQKQDLILLDPHQVTESVPLDKSDDSLRHGHLSYHCGMMRKIHISKIDTTLAFGFYLRDYDAYKEFQGFLEQNRRIHRDNWLFSHFDSKPKDFSYLNDDYANDDFQLATEVQHESLQHIKQQKTNIMKTSPQSTSFQHPGLHKQKSVTSPKSKAPQMLQPQQKQGRANPQSSKNVGYNIQSKKVLINPNGEEKDENDEFEVLF